MLEDRLNIVEILLKCCIYDPLTSKWFYCTIITYFPELFEYSAYSDQNENTEGTSSYKNKQTIAHELWRRISGRQQPAGSKRTAACPPDAKCSAPNEQRPTPNPTFHVRFTKWLFDLSMTLIPLIYVTYICFYCLYASEMFCFIIPDKIAVSYVQLGATSVAVRSVRERRPFPTARSTVRPFTRYPLAAVRHN